MDIYQHVLSNLSGLDANSLEKNISEAAQSADEVALPGLGVVMKILWNNSSQNEKKAYINMLINSIS